MMVEDNVRENEYDAESLVTNGVAFKRSMSLLETSLSLCGHLSFEISTLARIKIVIISYLLDVARAGERVEKLLN